eukprot:756566-Hanusia_phi.AAC.2
MCGRGRRSDEERRGQQGQLGSSCAGGGREKSPDQLLPGKEGEERRGGWGGEMEAGESPAGESPAGESPAGAGF